jgi:hypothetical protein
VARFGQQFAGASLSVVRDDYANERLGESGDQHCNRQCQMTRETRELLAALDKLGRAIPQVLLGIWDDSLPQDKQVEFGDLLIAGGELLQAHARSEPAMVVESEVTRQEQG